MAAFVSNQALIIIVYIFAHVTDILLAVNTSLMASKITGSRKHLITHIAFMCLRFTHISNALEVVDVRCARLITLSDGPVFLENVG